MITLHTCIHAHTHTHTHTHIMSSSNTTALLIGSDIAYVSQNNYWYSYLLQKNYVKEIPKVEFIGLPIVIRILTRTSTSLVPSPTPGFSSLAVR